MSRLFTLSLVVALATVFSWGCTSSETPATVAGHAEESHAHGESALGKICGACGEEKGAESCCSDSAEKCEACGKNKGSLLCCVELSEDVAGKDLCGKCGHVAGSESCCAEDAETCACGMAKGSPLCCKLNGEEAEEGAETE